MRNLSFVILLAWVCNTLQGQPIDSSLYGFFTLHVTAGYGYSSNYNDVDEVRLLDRGLYVLRNREPRGYSLGGGLVRHTRSGRWRVGVSYYRYVLPVKVDRVWPVAGTNIPLVVFDEFAQKDAGNAFLLTLGVRLLQRGRFGLGLEATGGPVWHAVDDVSVSSDGAVPVRLRTLRTSNANFNELFTQGTLRASYDLNPYYRLLGGVRHNWIASVRDHPLTEVFVGIELNLVRGGVPTGQLLHQPRR